MECEMSKDQINWGIISTARIGQRAVIPAIQASCNGRVLGIASRQISRAKSFAANLSIPRAYGSYEALLDDEDIDAVYIPLPNSMHHEWTIKAVNKGKHVLCEKPMALNAVECVEMEHAADENHVKLMEAFMYRFHPRIESLIELVRGGEIGSLGTIVSAFTFRLEDKSNIRYQPELGGGALMDVGCYCVNIIRTIAGMQPDAVTASAQWTSSGVDGHLAGTLYFDKGITGQFDCALTMESRQYCQAAGSGGYLDIPRAFLPGKTSCEMHEYHGGKLAKTPSIAGVDQYQLMVEHFADSILHDQPVRYPPSDAIANMRVIDALYRSARSGHQIEEIL
jgi:xylose dehydrogenase (NAD/NADP)